MPPKLGKQGSSESKSMEGKVDALAAEVKRLNEENASFKEERAYFRSRFDEYVKATLLHTLLPYLYDSRFIWFSTLSLTL